MSKRSKKEQGAAEDFARGLFYGGKLADLCRFAQEALEHHPQSFELWKIFGAALGALGRTKEARRAFLAALDLVPNDPTAIANYITSCFHDGDAKSGVAAIELYFDELPNEVQSIVLNSLAESIQNGLVSESQLPPVILSLFESDSEILSDLEFDPNAGADRGYYELSKQDVRKVIASFEEIRTACAAAAKTVKKGKLSVREAEDAYNFIEDRLVEIAVVLDGALD